MSGAKNQNKIFGGTENRQKVTIINLKKMGHIKQAKNLVKSILIID